MHMTPVTWGLGPVGDPAHDLPAPPPPPPPPPTPPAPPPPPDNECRKVRFPARAAVAEAGATCRGRAHRGAVDVERVTYDSVLTMTADFDKKGLAGCDRDLPAGAAALPTDGVPDAVAAVR